jgi:hypothetical protein
MPEVYQQNYFRQANIPLALANNVGTIIPVKEKP